ncbi:MAG TPA: helix-turn-helix domain-containing protein [Dehalococcoidia bacterium]
MPVKINGRIYYRTAEVCQIVGIGKSTLFRWIRQNTIKDAEYRDRKGWRLFTESELLSLKSETNKIQSNRMAKMGKIPSTVL